MKAKNQPPNPTISTNGNNDSLGIKYPPSIAKISTKKMFKVSFFYLCHLLYKVTVA